jgi:hypothetical protein
MTDLSSGQSLTVSSGQISSSIVVDNSGLLSVTSGWIVGGTVTFGGHGDLTIAATKGVGLTVSGFELTDALDLSGFKFAKTESCPSPRTRRRPVLTITDGALTAKVTLFGQYVQAGFYLAADMGGGTVLTYVSPPASHSVLADSSR